MAAGSQATLPPGQASAKHGRTNLLFVVPYFLCSACASDLTPVQPLHESASINFAGSETQDIQFEVPTDRPILISVSARDVDVKATILRPDAAAGSYADAPNRRMGIETLLVEPPHDAAIALRLSRNDHRDARGIVTIKVIALPTITSADRTRLAAVRFEAAACISFPDPANGKESAEAFRSAADLNDRIGDLLKAGTALLHAAGARYARLDDWKSAAELAASAATRLQEVSAPALSAFALRVEGAALDQLANAMGQELKSRDRTANRARLRLTEAARGLEALGFTYEAGYALNYRGVSFLESGERERARADFGDALALFRAAHDEPAQALSLQSLAVLSHEDGRLSDAMREFDAAMALIPRDAEPENYAHTLHNSAMPLRVLGRFDEAIFRYFEAGQILRELGDRDGEARALHGLGTTLKYAGEPERASELLRAAIKLRGETGAKREQAVSLFVLGQIERETRQIDSAISVHKQALALVVAPHERAQARLELARDLLALGDLPSARRNLDEILRLGLPMTHRYLGLALIELGRLESLEGNRQASREAFARAIRIHKTNSSDLELARAFHFRAEADLRTGDTRSVREDTAIALQIFEETGLKGAQAETRAAFRATYRDVVELRIAALLLDAESARHRGDLAESQRLLWTALAASDGARARLLAESWLSGSNAGDVPRELLVQREATYELLAGKRQRRETLLEAVQPDTGRLAELAREIALLRAQARLIEGRMARLHGTVDIKSVADGDDILDSIPSEVLVAEYFLGKTYSWLFAVRNGVIAVHLLPDTSAIESLARQLHISWQMTTGSSGNRLAASRQLAEIIFGPLGAATPAGALQIVPDGALHLVPMALLARQTWPDMRPGSATVAPSLSALNTTIFDDGPAPDLPLAIIADPVYSADDSRIDAAVRQDAAVRSVARADNLPLTRTGRNLDSLQRLPSTAIEARDLIALVDDPAGTLALLGPDANRHRIVTAPMSRYRILHFATHAMADSEDPALATIALSRWNAEGEAIDGALRLYDIARMRLNADLVVLSGCDTALGREIAGEGPMGLAQTFLRSGAKAVVATLWQVPDTSTAILMREFYRQMLTNNLETAVALQLAQDAVRRRAKWSDPFYWAGFQLISTMGMERNNKSVARREE